MKHALLPLGCKNCNSDTLYIRNDGDVGCFECDSKATPTVKDSGARESFPTGSVRDTRAGKGRYDLLPTRALRRVARHFEAGAVKYGDRNWEKGQPISRYLDSALRHTFNHLEGQRDEDHLAAAAWNILAAIETEERGRIGLLPVELNDLPAEFIEFPKYGVGKSLEAMGGAD